MPTRDGYKTTGVIMEELGATEEQARAYVALLKTTHIFLSFDPRWRYYSHEVVARVKEAVSQSYLNVQRERA